MLRPPVRRYKELIDGQTLADSVDCYSRESLHLLNQYIAQWLNLQSAASADI